MRGIVGPGEGEALSGEDRELRVKTVRPELDLLEYDVGPGYEGPGPHFHKRHVDSFYVLEGELEFTIGGETVRAGAETFVLVPPGVVHAFTNPGPGSAWFLNVHAPETGFVELLRARDRGEEPDSERFDVWDADGDARGSARDAIVLGAGEGRRVSDRLVIKAGRDELVATDTTFEAGRRGPAPHVHRRQADSFYVLEGELAFLLGDENVRAPAGSFVVAPANFVHTFWNPGPAPARYLNFHTPGAGFDTYLFERPREGESQSDFYARFDTFTVDRPHPADT
jgi:mannose-6-phosphate isomerase-like protein (cupin superfamily)